MMDELIAVARSRNIKKLIGYYYPTVKNAVVKNFYELQGFTKLEEDDVGNTTWEFIIPHAYEKKQNVIALNDEENSDAQ